MWRKLLLEIIRLSAQNNWFTNIKHVTAGIIEFTNGWVVTRELNNFRFQCFEDRAKPINTSIDSDAIIGPDAIKVIKKFLSDEFHLDGEKK